MNDFSEKTFEGFQSEIKLQYCGRRIRNLAHSYGPFIRSDFLLYFIKEGSAELTINGSKRIISEKGFFVNFPRSGCIYHSSGNLPWSIKWICAEGRILEYYLSLIGITREDPFLPLNDPISVERVFDEMYELFDRNALSAKFQCVSLFHKLFGILAEASYAKKTENQHIARALLLIENNYRKADLSVGEIAREVGLNQNYFSILFKRETGKLPKRMISELRLENACKMLKYTDRTIKQIAIENGFTDEFYFSRAFRDYYGLSPANYRRKEEYLI